VFLRSSSARKSSSASLTCRLYPRKGTIAVGSDADIAIWDPKKKVKLTHVLLKDASDYTPYEGLNASMSLDGWCAAYVS
jgi:dihydropyrimidinase